jgi:hypothetical protein
MKSWKKADNLVYRERYKRSLFGKQYRSWLDSLQVGDAVGVLSPRWNGAEGINPAIWYVSRLSNASVWLEDDERRFNRRSGFIAGDGIVRLMPIIVRAGQTVIRENDASDGGDLIGIPVPFFLCKAPGVR